MDKYIDGKTELPGGSFQENKAIWHPSDFHFTRKGNAFYAFMMRTGGEGKGCHTQLR